MARAATAAVARPKARASAAPARAKAAPARTKTAPARTKTAPARHSTRRRAAAAPRRAPAPRRVSGRAAAPAVPLPVRVLNAPFARAARRRTGSVLDALLAGRGWIALVFVLLAGIVFFNVDLLQMNRDIARNDEKISALRREIARNRLDVARLASSKRIQESAGQLGLVQPAPGEVRYLKARPSLDARQAAKRITAPNLAYVPPPPIDTAPEPVVPDPTTGTDPAAIDPAATDPAVADPAAADPAAVPAPATTATPAG
jgi:cell division protein FtsL